MTTTAADKFALIPVSALKPLTEVPPRSVRLYFALRLRFRPGYATWAADKILCNELDAKPENLRRDLGELSKGGLLQIQTDKVDGRRNTYEFQHSGINAKVPEAVVRHDGISGTQLIVYAALRNAVHWKRKPTLEALGKRYGITLRTLKRSLRSLEELGLVVVSKVPMGGRAWKNSYSFPDNGVPKRARISTDLALRDVAIWHSEPARFGTSLKEGETVYEETEDEEPGTTASADVPSAAVVKEILSVEQQEQEREQYARFVQAVPKRTGDGSISKPGAVAAAYREARKKASADYLIWCATVYAREMAGKSDVTQRPENWLRRGEWLNYSRKYNYFPANQITPAQRRQLQNDWYGDDGSGA